jgi:GT2 family glycosyltransferase
MQATSNLTVAPMNTYIEIAEGNSEVMVESEAAGTSKDRFLKRSVESDLSIVIVNWNTRQLTLDCLRSISEQLSGFRAQIIVVDNASEDDSVKAIRSEFPQVVIIENCENLGFAKANNRGLRECTGRYVLLINSDVLLRDGCFLSLYDYIEQHPDIGVLGPRILNGDLSLQESCKEFPTVWNTLCRAFALDSAFPNVRLFSSQLMRYWSHDNVQPVDILSGCFWMVRREALAQVGPLDERFFMYAEDKDWCKRYWKAGWSVVYYPGAEAIHLAASSSARDPIRFYIEMNRANLRYWKKHFTGFEQIAIPIIMAVHESLRIIGASLNFILRPSRRQETRMKMQRSLAVLKMLIFDFSKLKNNATAQ